MTIQDRTAPTAAESDCATVFVAIELSRSSWVVAVHRPPVDKIRLHKLAAGDVEGLLALIQEADVGVKWKVQRGWRASHARTLGCLCVA